LGFSGPGYVATLLPGEVGHAGPFAFARMRKAYRATDSRADSVIMKEAVLSLLLNHYFIHKDLQERGYAHLPNDYRSKQNNIRIGNDRQQEAHFFMSWSLIESPRGST